MRRRAFWIAAVALPACLALPAGAAIGDAGPGCRTASPAVAHHAGGAALGSQPDGAPTPCGMGTGFAGGESAIAVSNTGAVFYAPAVQAVAGVQTQYFLGGNSGFARTTDLGRTWKFIDPVSTNIAVPTDLAGTPGYPAWDQIDDKFYADRETGRLFWTDPDLPSEVVLWTDDNGLTWGYSLLPVGFGGEWTQVTTAKARTSTTAGYPKVVYACGEYDSVGRDFGPAASGDLCQKSLDGGQTWITAGQAFFGAPVNTHPECGGQDEHPDFSPWAAPDSHGRLFELLFCAGKSFLIRSDDEGATWPVHARLPDDLPTPGPGGTGTAELRSDAADNLYLAWEQPGAVYLRVSSDYGRTWGPKMNVLAPGVVGSRTHFGFDVGAPGDVAVSYLGHRNGRPGFDGYITQTHNALAAQPVFWSGVVNDAAQAPLDSGGPGSSHGLGLDYVSAAIGPDGVPWASFWDACGMDLPQPDPACPKDRSPSSATTLGYMDFAGRLAPAAATSTGSPRAPCVDARKFTFRLHHSRRSTIVEVEVFVNGRRTLTRRGRDIRSVTVKRLPQSLFQLKIVSTQSTGSKLISTRTYRGCRKGRPRTRGRHRHRHRR